MNKWVCQAIVDRNKSASAIRTEVRSATPESSVHVGWSYAINGNRVNAYPGWQATGSAPRCSTVGADVHSAGRRTANIVDSGIQSRRRGVVNREGADTGIGRHTGAGRVPGRTTVSAFVYTRGRHGHADINRRRSDG